MRGEETSGRLLVEVDGAPLPQEVAAALSSATVDDSLSVPDMFVLRFLDDGASAIEKARVAIGSSVRLRVQLSGTSAPVPLLEGEVTGLETDLSALGTRTVIRGYDMSHRLFRGRRVEAYVDAKPGDIARRAATRVGLTPGRIDNLGSVHKHVSQDGVNDWAFLSRLGAEVGAVLSVVDGALDFRTPTSADDAPPDGRSRENPLVLEKGVNLVSLRASVTAADQVPQVQVRSWDVTTKQPLVASADAGTTSAHVDSVQPQRLAGLFQSPPWVEARPHLLDHAACQTMAEAIAGRLAGSCAELEGVARGNPKLRAGTAVTLVKAGTPFDGRYTLTSTRHEFTAETGYRTAFTVSNQSDRSVYGLATGAGGGARSATVGGVVTATVNDVKDPDRLGRVRVTFPVMSDTYVSGWARPVQVGAGPGRGMALLPEVGDEVLVAFGLGDFSDPYVIGGLYNGKDRPEPGWEEHIDTGNGSVKRRALTSRTGMTVAMVESATEERLEITTNDGRQRIALVQKGDASVEVISEGPVSVTAKKDVTVSTGTGTVSLSGQQVSIDAKTDLVLRGATVSVSAKGAAELTGATVKAAGQASAELSATGVTTVKGSMVKIN